MRESWFLDSESPKRAPCAKAELGSDEVDLRLGQVVTSLAGLLSQGV
jgi:hypothetical protein